MKRLLTVLISALLTGFATLASAGAIPVLMSFGQSASAPVYLNITEVQVSSVLTGPCIFSSPQTAGNFNYVAIGWYGSNATIASVTDTLGNTYAAAGPAANSAEADQGNLPNHQQIYYATNIAGGTSNSVNVTFSGTAPTGWDTRCSEWNGVSKTSPLDQYAVATANTGTALSAGPTGATSQTAEVLIASGYVEGGITNVSSGYTQIVLSGGGNNTQYQVVSATGAYTAGATAGPSGSWIMQLATFRAATTSVPTGAYFVATNGNDSGPGTLAAPFLTLAHAQASMAAGSIKTTYVRGGTYSNVALRFTSADSGESWNYYAPDGYDSAIIDGGATSGSTGNNPVMIDGASNFTWNGFTVQHCKFICIGIHGGPADPNTPFQTATAAVSNVSITNNIISNSFTNPAFGFIGGGVLATTNVTNLTVADNVIHDTALFGVDTSSHMTWNAGDVPADHGLGNLTGLTIQSNFLYNTCTGTTDCGSIYFSDGTGSPDSPFAGNPQTTGVTIHNNFIRDYQGTSTTPTSLLRDVAIYLDDGGSNVTISGNVIANTANVIPNPTTVGSTTAYWSDGNKNNTFTGNIIDLGTTAKIADAAWATTTSPNPTYPMTGHTASGNILIGRWAGTQQASLFGNGVGSGWYFNSGNPPTPTPTNNQYFNYGSGSLSTTSSNGRNDSAPVTGVDPLFASGQCIYTLNGASPVFSAPLNFPAIAGGWGPPGYTIPCTGTAPSYQSPGTTLLSYLTSLMHSGQLDSGQTADLFAGAAAGPYGNLLDQFTGTTPATMTIAGTGSKTPAIIDVNMSVPGATCGIGATPAQGLKLIEDSLSAGNIVQVTVVLPRPTDTTGCQIAATGGEFPGVLKVGGSCSAATNPALCNAYFYGQGCNSGSACGGVKAIGDAFNAVKANNPNSMLIYRPMHENNLSNVFWWGTGGSGPTAAQEIQLYKQTVDQLRAQGVTNVLYMQSYNWFSGSYAANDPGVGYRDVIGMDFYCCTPTDSTAAMSSAMSGSAPNGGGGWAYVNSLNLPVIAAEVGNSNANNSSISLHTYDTSHFNNQFQGFSNASNVVATIFFTQNWCLQCQNNPSGYLGGSIIRTGIPPLTNLRPAAQVTHMHEWRAKRQRPLLRQAEGLLRDAA